MRFAVVTGLAYRVVGVLPYLIVFLGLWADRA